MKSLTCENTSSTAATTKDLGPDPAVRVLLESAPYGVVISDTTGIIIFANEVLLRMFDYSEAELLGQRLEILIPERHRTAHVPLREAYAQSPTRRTMGTGRDLTGRRKNGVEFPVEIGLSSQTSPEGTTMIATVTDITERKRSEMQLREANAQLEEFAYVASHDLKSPIRGIGNLVDFIREDLGNAGTSEVHHHLDRMHDRVKRMEQLIDDLLIYARAGKRSIRFERITPETLIEDLIKLEPIPEGMTLNLDLRAAPFDGALTPLSTVLRNLYTNAIRHHDRTIGNITIRMFEEGAYLVIEVADDGPGIPKSSQGRAFRLFQTLTAGERKGTGLGLAVSKRMVDGHGGQIELISNDGVRGTTFRIHWPRFVRTDLDD